MGGGGGGACSFAWVEGKEVMFLVSLLIVLDLDSKCIQDCRELSSFCRSAHLSR